MKTLLVVALLLVSMHTETSRADDADVAKAKVKAEIPTGLPPRVVHVASVDVEGGQLVYRDYFDAPAKPNLQGPTKHSEMLATRPTGGGGPRAILVTFPLEGGKVVDAKGNRVWGEALKTRLEPGTVVLVPRDHEPIDPIYLRSFRDDTLILIFPRSQK